MDALLSRFCKNTTTLEDLQWLVEKGARPTEENMLDLLKNNHDLAVELCNLTNYGDILKHVDMEKLWEHACINNLPKLLKLISDHPGVVSIETLVKRFNFMENHLIKPYDHAWLITKRMSVEEVTNFLSAHIEDLFVYQLENIITHVNKYDQDLMNLMFDFNKFRQVAKQYYDKYHKDINVDDLLSNPTQTEAIIKIIEKMDKKKLLNSLIEKKLLTSNHISELLVSIYREIGEEKTIKILLNGGCLSI